MIALFLILHLYHLEWMDCIGLGSSIFEDGGDGYSPKKWRKCQHTKPRRSFSPLKAQKFVVN